MDTFRGLARVAEPDVWESSVQGVNGERGISARERGPISDPKGSTTRNVEFRKDTLPQDRSRDPIKKHFLESILVGKHGDQRSINLSITGKVGVVFGVVSFVLSLVNLCSDVLSSANSQRLLFSVLSMSVYF